MLNPKNIERAINGARIGGLIGLIGYYIPLLSGFINLEPLLPAMFLFVLTAASAATVGAIVGYLTHSKKSNHSTNDYQSAKLIQPAD